jgi:cell wall-associated NlpC family hydrolase
LFDDLLTKKYAPGGHGPNTYDCWGLCEEVARRVGKPMLSFPEWVGKVSRAAVFEKMRDAHFKRLKKPQAYCIALFKTTPRNGPYSYHVGTVLEGCKRFIHATRTTGIIISRIADFGGGELVGFYEYVESGSS